MLRTLNDAKLETEIGGERHLVVVNIIVVNFSVIKENPSDFRGNLLKSQKNSFCSSLHDPLAGFLSSFLRPPRPSSEDNARVIIGNFFPPCYNAECNHVNRIHLTRLKRIQLVTLVLRKIILTELYGTLSQTITHRTPANANKIYSSNINKTLRILCAASGVQIISRSKSNWLPP